MIVVRKSQLQALEKKRKRTNVNMLLSGILLGAAIGGLIALLFAPKSGTDTRAGIYGKANSLGDKCKSLFGNCCCCCTDDCEDDCCEEGCCCAEDPSEK